MSVHLEALSQEIQEWIDHTGPSVRISTSVLRRWRAILSKAATEPVAVITIMDGQVLAVDKIGETPPDGTYYIHPAR